MRPQDRVLAMLKERVRPGAQVLDAGCGDGRLAGMAADAGYAVSCFDKRIFCEKRPDIRYAEGDLADTLPYDDRAFDAATITEVLEHLKAPFHAVHELARVLKPGGWLFISLPNYWTVRHRIRFLFTGNLQRPVPANDKTISFYHRNLCPHINAFTWPVLRFALVAEGFTPETVVSAKIPPLYRRLPSIVAAIPLAAGALAVPAGRRAESGMDVTSSIDILAGGSRVVIASRLGVDNAATPPNGRDQGKPSVCI